MPLKRLGGVSALAMAVGAFGLALSNGAWGHGAHFATGEPGDAKKPARLVEILAREGDGKMSYVPDRVEVTKGEQIRFVIKNEGELDHEFLLDTFEGNAKHKVEMEKNPEMEHDDPNGKRVVSKKSAEILWRFTKEGTFEFACLIPGHYEAGMKGVVVVTAARGKPSAGKK